MKYYGPKNLEANARNLVKKIKERDGLVFRRNFTLDVGLDNLGINYKDKT